MNKTILISIICFLALLSPVMAQHFNGTILEQNFNLTKLMSAGDDSAIDNPVLWVANWNQEMEDIGLVTFLYVFGGLLFLIIRRRPEVKDSEAVVYAGFVCTLLGIMMFVIDIVSQPEYKLLKWASLLPIVVITASAVVSNIVNQNF